MSSYGLADFLEELGQAGELVRVAPEVDPVLEIAEVAERVGLKRGPTLLFGAVRGHSIPVLANLLGTEARIRRALTLTSLDDLTLRIGELLRPADPESWFEKLRVVPARAELKRLAPRVVKSAVCQQVVRLGGDVDLRQLPALQSRPLELGRTLTAAQVVSGLPGSAERIVGRYDLCVVDRDRLAVAWLLHDDHARLLADYRRRREPMPVALVLGGHPAGLLAAMLPLPPDSDRQAFAGLLRGKPLELVRCRTLDLEVCADAEIVLEGSIDPDEPLHETGPLAAPGGFYQASRPAPVVRVSAVTHRANPIFPAMIPGYSGDEACVVASVLHRWVLPLVRSRIPELVDYHFPLAAGSRYCGIVAIRKGYAGQARRVASALWGMPSLMHVKLWILVDDGVNVTEPDEVWSAVSAHVDAGRDVLVEQGPPDLLDPAAAMAVPTKRMAIDATAKLAGEGGRQTPSRAEMSEEIRRLVRSRWSQYGLGQQP
ncbi:MAG: UbiD family decarboxylase [Pirellulales bacterium]|nr:UbiD family decarboxylase [Pirellulales bacterium]